MKNKLDTRCQSFISVKSSKEKKARGVKEEERELWKDVCVWIPTVIPMLDNEADNLLEN